jgi:type IV secretion system protein VirB2
MFCTVAGWFSGSTGKGLATIAITIVGIGALLGKVSWGMAMIVGVGVAIVFGAASIVEALGVKASSGGTGGCKPA